MKMTLLDMVQNILSAMDSDEVNSISDTIESLQVAYVVRETYFEQFNNIIVPEHKGLFQLESVNDVNKPNYLVVPDAVKDFDWVRYVDTRNSSRFVNVSYCSPETFLERQYQYTSSSDNVVLTQDPVSGVEYYIKTNKVPTWYTMFDDQYLAFDSFDQTYDATLQTSKSAAFGTKANTFPLTDTFTPPLDDNLFPLLLAEAKSVCFINFKQIANAKEETRARRQRIRMQNDQFKSKVAQRNYEDHTPNFARNR